MWWRRIPHLLLGLALVAGSLYSLGGMVEGWRSTRRWLIVSGRTSVKPQVENVEIPGEEKTKSLGVLPSLMGNQNENEKDEETEVASASGPPLGVDRISSSKALAPRRFLHRRISVKAYEGFGFEVPAHATRPRIHGEFNSFVVDGSGELRGENVEVLLLSEEEYRDFVHGRAGAASFGRPASAGAVIDWTLDATLFEPLKYYLVFRNSSPERQTELVDADFSLSFD